MVTCKTVFFLNFKSDCNIYAHILSCFKKFNLVVSNETTKAKDGRKNPRRISSKTMTLPKHSNV